MKTKIDVGFAYIGNGFSVESITSALDILPTKAWDKGEKINYEDILTKDISKDTKRKFMEIQNAHTDSFDMHRKSTKWEVSVGQTYSLDINEQFKKLIRILDSKVNKILEVNEKFNMTPQISIVIEVVNGETPAIFFDSQTVNFVSKIKGSIDIDLYYMQYD